MGVRGNEIAAVLLPGPDPTERAASTPQDSAVDGIRAVRTAARRWIIRWLPTLVAIGGAGAFLA